MNVADTFIKYFNYSIFKLAKARWDKIRRKMTEITQLKKWEKEISAFT